LNTVERSVLSWRTWPQKMSCTHTTRFLSEGQYTLRHLLVCAELGEMRTSKTKEHFLRALNSSESSSGTQVVVIERSPRQIGGMRLNMRLYGPLTNWRQTRAFTATLTSTNPLTRQLIGTQAEAGISAVARLPTTLKVIPRRGCSLLERPDTLPNLEKMKGEERVFQKELGFPQYRICVLADHRHFWHNTG
jgi:hypothetical protein